MRSVADKIESHGRIGDQHSLPQRALPRPGRLINKCRYWQMFSLLGMLAASPAVAGGAYVSNGDLYWSGKKACVEWGYSGGSGVNRCNAAKDKQAYPCRGIFKRGDRMDVRRNIPRGARVLVRVCI